MYNKYLKTYIGLVLLILVTNNCDGSKGSQHMENTNPTGKVTFEQLEQQLKTGPIFIGESHGKEYAREAIIALAKKGLVKKLFLELPNLEDTAHADLDTAKHLSTPNRAENKGVEIGIKFGCNGITSGHGNPYKMGDFILDALKHKDIAIYYHDVPMDEHSRCLINGKYEVGSYTTSSEGIKERNKYSAKYIETKGIGKYTVILAGQEHLEVGKIQKVETLQALLNVGEDRVFDLSSHAVGK